MMVACKLSKLWNWTASVFVFNLLAIIPPSWIEFNIFLNIIKERHKSQSISKYGHGSKLFLALSLFNSLLNSMSLQDIDDYGPPYLLFLWYLDCAVLWLFFVNTMDLFPCCPLHNFEFSLVLIDWLPTKASNPTYHTIESISGGKKTQPASVYFPHLLARPYYSHFRKKLFPFFLWSNKSSGFQFLSNLLYEDDKLTNYRNNQFMGNFIGHVYRDFKKRGK